MPQTPDTFAPVITGLVLMVPEARTVTPHAHITLLAPFGARTGPTPGELDEAARFFADQSPFDYRLTGVSTFPQGSHYLVPEPGAKFSRLTHALHRRFPEYPPYAGAFDLVVPHLTVPDDARIPPLPLVAHARAATLLHADNGTFTELATFPFGTSAA